MTKGQKKSESFHRGSQACAVILEEPHVSEEGTPQWSGPKKTH